MSDELPQGWTTARVEEVIEDSQPGFASGEKNVEGGVAHLRMNNIGLDGQLVLDLVRTVPEKLVKSYHNLRPGDVLVCTTNSGKLVGKCAYFDLPGRYAFSNHLTRLRPKRDVVDGHFLRWNLWLKWKWGAFDDKCKHWVNQSTIPKAALLETEMSVPPLAEQRRIVAKLEKLLGKVEACQKRLVKIPVFLRRFRQSILAAACSGRLTADWRKEHGDYLWEEKAIGEIKNFIGSGITPKGGSSTYVAAGIPFIRSQNVYPNGLALDDIAYVTPEMHQKMSRTHVRPLDVLLNITGASIGRSTIVPENFGEGNVNQHVCIIRVQSIMSPRFLSMFLNSPNGQDLIFETQVGVTREGLNYSQLRAFFVPVPLLAEQEEIIRRVEKLFQLAETIEARYAKAKAFVDKLTQSILAKAFRGELIPQDPNDEPASVLLSHITAHRDNLEKKKQKRTRIKQVT